MAVIDANTLFSETRCYACLGFSIPQLLELGILRRTVLDTNPSADVTVDGLMAFVRCYACFNLTQFELLSLALTAQISTASPDPYFNALVYIQQDGTTTTITNPVGAYNLTGLVPQVTAIHCHDATGITSLSVSNDPILTVVDLEDLPNLASLSLINCDGLTTLDLSTFTNLSLVCSFNFLLTSIDLSGLVSGSLNLVNNVVLSSVNLASLQIASVLYLNSCPAMTGQTMPAMVAYPPDVQGRLSGLNSITVLPLVNGGNYDFFSAALNQTTVDLLLAMGVAGGMNSGGIDTSGGTNSVPSAAGLVNKGILIGAGASVTTN